MEKQSPEAKLISKINLIKKRPTKLVIADLIVARGAALTLDDNALIAANNGIQNALVAAAILHIHTGGIANGLAANVTIQPLIIADLIQRAAALAAFNGR